MFGLPLGIFVESAVAVLLVLTIGYCVLLNHRLQRLHADKDMMRQMVADLVSATNLANQAIKELKQTAVEADSALSSRLEEAERFGIQLAKHVTAGTSVLERMAKITRAVRHTPLGEPESEPNKVRSALEQLSSRVRNRGVAA